MNAAQLRTIEKLPTSAPEWTFFTEPLTRGGYDREGFPQGALLLAEDGTLYLNISPLCGNSFYDVRPVSPATWKCAERDVFPGRRWVHDLWVQIGQVASR